MFNKLKSKAVTIILTITTAVFMTPTFSNGFINTVTQKQVSADFNKQVRELAAETSAILNEANDGRYPNDPRFLAFDRLHLNPEGHHRVAQGVLETLGMPFDESYKIPLPPAEPVPFVQRKATNALWIATFVIPWLIRRLRGKSSGDGRAPKYPTLINWPN